MCRPLYSACRDLDHRISDFGFGLCLLACWFSHLGVACDLLNSGSPDIGLGMFTVGVRISSVLIYFEHRMLALGISILEFVHIAFEILGGVRCSCFVSGDYDFVLVI